MRVHPTHRREIAKALRTIGVLFVALVGIGLIGPQSRLAELANYLPVHIGLETASIVVGVLVFAVGWSSPQRETSRNVVVLACVLLGVAVLDFSHMLSFPGMPPYVTAADTEKAIAFWIAGRAFMVCGLFAVALLPWDTPSSPRGRILVMGFVTLGVAAVHVIVFFHMDDLPRTFVPGVGLTGIKIAAEYVLVACYLLVAALVLPKLAMPRRFDASSLFAATITLALAEVALTWYVLTNDAYNLAGHVFKAIGYLFLYRALFVETVQQPYERLDAARAQLTATVEALPDLLFEMSEDGIYLAVHTPSGDGLLLPSRDLVGRSLRDIMPPESADTALDAIQEAKLTGRSRGKTIALDVAGVTLWFELSVSRKAPRGGEQPRYLVLSRDITDRRRMEERIQHFAFFDSLTGLPNRSLLDDRLRVAILRHERNERYGALLFLDLDEFKELNDSLGHSAGDQLLVAVAGRLSAAVRKTDTVSRFGGDEFVIVLGELDTDEFYARAQAARIAEKIRAALAVPYDLKTRRPDGAEGDVVHTCTASIGVAIFKAWPESHGMLLHFADTAMYRAKQLGGNAVCFADDMPTPLRSREMARPCNRGQAG